MVHLSLGWQHSWYSRYIKYIFHAPIVCVLSNVLCVLFDNHTCIRDTLFLCALILCGISNLASSVKSSHNYSHKYATLCHDTSHHFIIYSFSHFHLLVSCLYQFLSQKNVQFFSDNLAFKLDFWFIVKLSLNTYFLAGRVCGEQEAEPTCFNYCYRCCHYSSQHTRWSGSVSPELCRAE